MNLLAVGAILLALMVPLLRVDRPRPVPSSSGPAVVAQQSGTPVMVLLRFVHAPVEVSLTVGGQVIPLRGAGLERQGETILAERGQALEMELKAAWPPDAAGTRWWNCGRLPMACPSNNRISGRTRDPSMKSCALCGGPRHEHCGRR